jgi:hypothetical protein
VLQILKRIMVTMPSIRMHWKDLSFSRVREEIDYITIVLIILAYIHVRVTWL